MSLTRSEIEGWPTAHLDDAATRWRAAADDSDNAFEQHRANVGGVNWSGDARDAAFDRVTADLGVVRRQGDVQRAAAQLAEDGGDDIRAAVRKVLEAITEAEADGFRVSEGLTVTDTRRADITTMASRRTALLEHAEDIRFHADQLMQADALVGRRIEDKATELAGIKFADPDRTVQAVGHKLGPPGLGDLPQTGDDPFLSPGEDQRPPHGSQRGGGRWDIDYDHPYQGAGTPTSPPLGKPWHRDLPPVTGHPSGFKDVVTPPPNGWGATPGWNLQEAYRFRVVGEGFDGSPGHTRWFLRDDNWYPATWVGYEFEAEHRYQLIPQNDGGGLMRPSWGAGVWEPMDTAGISKAWADNPGLTLYIPNPYGGIEEFPGKTTGARGS